MIFSLVMEEFGHIVTALTRCIMFNSLRPSDAYKCVDKLTIIGSDNGLSPGRRQAIIWTNAAILLIGPVGTNFSEILIEILTFSFMKMRWKVSSAKRRPFCLGLNVLRHWNFICYMCIFSKSNPFVVVSWVDINWSSSCAAVNRSLTHIEAETKWTPFRRRYFQVHFLEWKCFNSD